MISILSTVCTGCGTCKKVCPHGVIALEEKKAYLVAEERCIECGACQLNCADGAIAVTKGVGCLLAIIRDDILKLQRPDGGCCGCG